MIIGLPKTSPPHPSAARPAPSPLAPNPKTSPRARLFLWVFSTAMVLTAGSAFIFKLCEFYLTATTQGSKAMASFLIPVLNYLVVALGFACLFLWAYFSGQFRDLEAPKHRMLELQNQIDRAGG